MFLQLNWLHSKFIVASALNGSKDCKLCGKIDVIVKEDINTFLQYLVDERGYSRNTLSAYRNDLNQMMAFLEAEKKKGLLESNDELLKSYLIDLRGKGYSPATAARKVASARSFFKFMVNSGKLKENPARNLVPPQVKKHPPKILSSFDYRRLLAEVAKLSTPEAKRDIVMLELLHATGLRVSELVALNVKDIDLGNSRLHCSRGNSRRELSFDSHMGQVLRNYLGSDRLDLLYDEKEEALFLNRRGKRLTRQGFWQIVKSHAYKANLGIKITPHTLRHTFAVNKLQTGADIRSVQRLLGHARVSSTGIYRQSLSALR